MTLYGDEAPGLTAPTRGVACRAVPRAVSFPGALARLILDRRVELITNLLITRYQLRDRRRHLIISCIAAANVFGVVYRAFAAALFQPEDPAALVLRLDSAHLLCPIALEEIERWLLAGLYHVLALPLAEGLCIQKSSRIFSPTSFCQVSIIFIS